MMELLQDYAQHIFDEWHALGQTLLLLIPPGVGRGAAQVSAAARQK